MPKGWVEPLVPSDIMWHGRKPSLSQAFAFLFLLHVCHLCHHLCHLGAEVHAARSSWRRCSSTLHGLRMVGILSASGKPWKLQLLQCCQISASKPRQRGWFKALLLKMGQTLCPFQTVENCWTNVDVVPVSRTNDVDAIWVEVQMSQIFKSEQNHWPTKKRINTVTERHAPEGRWEMYTENILTFYTCKLYWHS